MLRDFFPKQLERKDLKGLVGVLLMSSRGGREEPEGVLLRISREEGNGQQGLVGVVQRPSKGGREGPEGVCRGAPEA